MKDDGGDSPSFARQKESVWTAVSAPASPSVTFAVRVP
jgi:hypothetical protein